MNLISPPSILPPGSTVWAYLRDSGGENQDRSIARQLEAIQAYCAQHRLELIHVYKDEAKSGTTTAGRDDFLRMIAQSDKQDHNPNGLLLWSFSRFGRNLEDATYYKGRLRHNGILIHSLTDQIPEGKFAIFAEMFIDLANEERSAQTAIDARDGLRSIVSQGAVPGTPPLGFKRVPIVTVNPRKGTERKNHRWVPNKKMIPRIRRAFQMRASGCTLSDIHKTTRLYNSINSYRTFFTNKLYIGILEFGDLVVENYCEPIIDMDTWNAVQKRVEEHAQARFKDHHPKRAHSIYLFSGYTVCARCGSPMNGNTVSRDSIHGRDEAYRCSRSKRHAGCDAGRVSRHSLETLVLSKLEEWILQPENIAAMQEIAIEHQTHGEQHRTERRAELNDEKAGVARSIANFTNAIAQAGHSNALLKSLKDAETRLAQIKHELDELEIPIEPVPRLSAEQIELTSRKIIDRIENAPLEEKRQHLREIIHEVRAERVGKNIFALITVYYPFDSAPTDGKMLPMHSAPVGAPRYRQLFNYPAEQKTRSK